MSIYCTLPRRQQYIDANQRRNTLVSVEEARKLVDELFNPIVAYDCDDSNEETNRYSANNQVYYNGNEESIYGNRFDNNNNKNSLSNSLNTSAKYSPAVRSAQSEQCLNFGNVTNVSKVIATRVANTATNSNISYNFNNTNAADNPETSYSSSTKLYYAFDNFEDLRRRRKSLMPDFYGGGIGGGGADSAYESSPSYESLKSVCDNKQFKRKSKYFTLPTRRSSKSNKQKDNVHEVAKTTGIYEPKIVSSLLPNKAVDANQVDVNIAQNNASNHQEFHCCCRAGCHNTISHSNRINSINNAGLHCCQQMLETLWEEPIGEATALMNNTRRPVSMTYNNYRQASNNKIEAHMVAAFEQSLSSMTARLQQLSASAELKDCELDRLRNTIENLKKQGLDSRLDSTNSCSFKQTSNKVKTASLIRRHTFNTTTNDGKGDGFGSKFSRQLSAESVSSVSSGADGSASQTKNKKKSKAKISANSSGWLRSSFTKAFKKNKGIVKRDAFSDAEVVGNGGSGNEGDSSSVPNSPLMSSRSFRSDSKPVNNDLNESETVQELKRQLREKEMILTDIRLESLTSAHQLENLKETVNQMRSEMLNLKQDNDRLQRLVSSKSLASSQSSMTSGVGPQNSHTTGSTFSCRINGTVGEDQNSIESLEMEAVTNALLCEGGKLVTVGSGTHIIASLVVTPKTNWDQLDLMIKKCFKDHINRIDSGTGLGLGLDSLACYQVGSEKIQRTILTVKSTSHLGNPEMLPFGYLVNENHIYLQFKSASDSLVFDTLIPKSIIHRFIGLLNEHRRIILCGPSGTGKTYLAHKLAEYLAIKRATDGKSPGTPIECCPAGSIATFSVDHKSAKELRAYLSNVAEQCDSEASSLHLPTVIILDNLHHVGSISEVFNGLLNITHTKCPYIIGTMNQTTCTTTNLQLNHNFRWVLCANHMEPVKGFLSRYLKRKLIETEVKMASNNMTPSGELIKIIDWIPKLWSHLNRFLEVHSSSDVTIGPRLFSSCPIDVSGSQVWFTDLWNYSIIPYVIEATREGIQMYGKRTQFVDPTEWVLENYPWTSSTDWTQHLLRIRPEDVNYESNVQTNINGNETLAQNSSDPLLNMLLRLQEAANYSNSSHPNESNNNHNNHNTSSVSIINSGLESTL